MSREYPIWVKLAIIDEDLLTIVDMDEGVV